jgi:hypothetical protein
MGIAWATDLMSTSLPPDDKHGSIHSCILFQILSFKNLKAPLVAEPISDGIPKYFSLRHSF